MKYIFKVTKFVTCTATEREGYIEFTFENGMDWRRYFVSKAGWSGQVDELREVGTALFNKRLRGKAA